MDQAFYRTFGDDVDKLWNKKICSAYLLDLYILTFFLRVSEAWLGAGSTQSLRHPSVLFFLNFLCERIFDLIYYV